MNDEKNNFLDLENLPIQVQFCYISITKSAIFFKEMDKEKDFFLSFCDEIWKSLELTDLEYLKDVLNGKMKKDVDKHIESYLKNKVKE